VLWFILGIIFLFASIHQGNLAAERTKQYEKAYIVWQNRINIWRDLYFCPTDSIIFIQGRPKLGLSTPENMDNFIDLVLSSAKL